MHLSTEIQTIMRCMDRAAGPLRAGDIAHQTGKAKRRVNALLYEHREQLFALSADCRWSVVVPARSRAVPTPASGVITVQAYFAPDESPLARICRLLDGATSEILVQAFYLDSPRISAAFIRAHQRGVVVRVLIGRTSSRRSRGWSQRQRHGGSKQPIVTALHEAGVDVAEDRGLSNQHNKVIVIDGTMTITGGLNFSDVAERNADNIVIITSAGLAKRFSDNWRRNRRLRGAPFAHS